MKATLSTPWLWRTTSSLATVCVLGGFDEDKTLRPIMTLVGPGFSWAAADIDAARSLSQAAHAAYLRAQALLPDCWELEYHIALHYFCIRKVRLAPHSSILMIHSPCHAPPVSSRPAPFIPRPHTAPLSRPVPRPHPAPFRAPQRVASL